MPKKHREFHEVELTDNTEINLVYAGKLQGTVYADGCVYAEAEALRQLRAMQAPDSPANSIDSPQAPLS